MSSIPSNLLLLSADYHLTIILASASYLAVDHVILSTFLVLCKDFCKLVLTNWRRSYLIEYDICSAANNIVTQPPAVPLSMT